MEMLRGFSTTDVKAMIADTLRLYVGHNRRLTWADLAAATGDEERKLRSYVEADGNQMPLDVFMRVFTILPPEAFARVARHMGFSTAVAEVDDEASVRRVLTATSKLVAQGNEFLEDGQLSHRERAQLADSAKALLPTLQAMAGTSIN